MFKRENKNTQFIAFPIQLANMSNSSIILKIQNLVNLAKTVQFYARHKALYFADFSFSVQNFENLISSFKFVDRFRYWLREKGLKIVIFVPVGVIIFIHSTRRNYERKKHRTAFTTRNTITTTTTTNYRKYYLKLQLQKKHVLLKCLVSSFYISNWEWSWGKGEEISPLNSFFQKEQKNEVICRYTS